MKNIEKEKIEFVTVDEMLEYAIKIFPDLISYANKTSRDAKEIRRSTMKQEIKRTLFEHKLIAKSSSTRAHTVSKEIAKFFIEHIMRDYFVQKIEEFEQLRKKLQEEERKKMFQEIDKQSTEEQQELFEIGTDEQIQERDGNNVDVVDEMIKLHPEKAEDYVDFGYNGVHNWIHKNNFSYHIPDKVWPKEDPKDKEGFPDGFVDQVIETMMLRTLFNKFFQFDERSFRQDLVRRGNLITIVEPKQFEPGYKELTARLENPVGYYVFPKEQKKGIESKTLLEDIYMNVINRVSNVLAKHEIITGHKLSKKEIENLRKHVKEDITKDMKELSSSAYYNSMRELFKQCK